MTTYVRVCMWPAHFGSEEEARRHWAAKPAAARVAVEAGRCGACGEWTVRVPDRLAVMS